MTLPVRCREGSFKKEIIQEILSQTQIMCQVDVNSLLLLPK